MTSVVFYVEKFFLVLCIHLVLLAYLLGVVLRFVSITGISVLVFLFVCFLVCEGVSREEVLFLLPFVLPLFVPEICV